MKRLMIWLSIGLMIGLSFSAFAETPKYFQWRWSDLDIGQMIDADGLHFVGSSYLAGVFDNTMPWWKADLATLGLGVGWEVKDALIPWELAGPIGGEGFSYKGDLILDASGIVFHRVCVLGWNRYKYGIWSLNSQKRKK